ncbi:hypothetical protein GNI_148120 [Gregarina niphandrodes]|uniref:Uncharacterized protein n=1 Tax=Gregarina niphandrodes TaxID=110365 RepID=A0A023AZT9_GRENI|nr:hypothetical protein GNI_148120 [Gregarina niphandrodes]EZG44369.1 hypothetical protein GNI_148120 [Gregarina niphandrodes]|eukprot:XP_011132684.1 hypothetical protein GNI_148120 [Gregarina niphandrodes]
MGRSRKYVLVDELNVLESETVGSTGIVDRSVIAALASRGSLLRVNADQQVALVHRGMTARDRYVNEECNSVRGLAYQLSRTGFLTRLPVPVTALLTRCSRLRLLYHYDKPLANIKVFQGVTARVYGNYTFGQLPSNQLPSNQLPSNQLPSNQLPFNQLPSNQLPSNQLPSNQLPSNQLSGGHSPLGQSPCSSRRQSSSFRQSPWLRKSSQLVSGQFLVLMLPEERLARQEYASRSMSSDLAAPSAAVASTEQSRQSLGQAIGQSIGQYIAPQRSVGPQRSAREHKSGSHTSASKMKLGQEAGREAVSDALPDVKQDELDCRRESFDLATSMLKGSSHETYVALVRSLVLGYLLNDPDAFCGPGAADRASRRDLVQYLRNSVTLVMLGLRFVGRTFAGSLILRLLTSFVADFDRTGALTGGAPIGGVGLLVGDEEEEEEVHWVPDSSAAGPITLYMIHATENLECPLVYAASTLPLTRRSMSQEGRRFEASCVALLHGGAEEVGRLGDLLGLPSPLEVNEEVYPLSYGDAASPRAASPDGAGLARQAAFAGLYRTQAVLILDAILSKIVPRLPPSDPGSLDLVAAFLTKATILRFSTQTT